jgi:hypothetical protein
VGYNEACVDTRLFGTECAKLSLLGQDMVAKSKMMPELCNEASLGPKSDV